jgi:uncharacterized membrane protein
MLWLLKWIPVTYFYIIVFIGIGAFALTYLIRFLPIPGIYVYRTLIQWISIGIISIGCFALGLVFDESSYTSRIKEMEEKVAAAEKQSKEQNVKIVEKLVTKTQVIKEKADAEVKYIDREIVKYDGSCVIPTEFVKAVNDAAGAPK